MGTRIAVAGLLLDAGADPNRRCEDGSTPLHFAAWRGPVEMVALLLSRGASPAIQDDSGKVPAAYTTDPAIFDTLKQAVIRSTDHESA